MENIKDYVTRKHDPSKISYMHPELEPVLAETYGIMIYQEQVQQAARVLAGYTLGGADILRRAMGKKIKEEIEQLGHEQNDTIELMLENVSLSGEHSDLVDPDGTGENQYLTNSNTTTTNVVRCILKMIQLEDPGRLIDISNNSDIQSVPFKVNDQLVFAITYNFNNFTPRTYLIRLLIVADENIENTEVQDGILYPYDYPYSE